MVEIASKQQLRLSFLRWAAVTVPLILFLGFLSGRLVPAGAQNHWYAALAKPGFTPPDWVFPVAWSAIYVLIGLALAMILHARGARRRGPAIALFVLQFVAALVWMPLFFGAHRVLASLVVIGVLWLLALATTIVFARIRVVAAWLMIPYLVWIAFAAALTWEIMRLNPDAERVAPSTPDAQIAI